MNAFSNDWNLNIYIFKYLRSYLCKWVFKIQKIYGILIYELIFQSNQCLNFHFQITYYR